MMKHIPLLTIGFVSQRMDGVMFGFILTLGRGPALAIGFCKPWTRKQFQPKTARIRKAFVDWGNDGGVPYFTAAFGMLRAFVSSYRPLGTS